MYSASAIQEVSLIKVHERPGGTTAVLLLFKMVLKIKSKSVSVLFVYSKGLDFFGNSDSPEK